MADVMFNVSNATTIDLYPADYYSLYADAIVPANSTVMALIDISLPLDGLSAIMTVVSMTVVRTQLFVVSVVMYKAGTSAGSFWY